ncbi:hypothetical protein LTR53_010989 [Teratosphaeriaceae sp. CCFEE 6253]|nr:hypothetical protein LTR53_010989 [Teratosphaeriaceae sp. CCFEE 6253]
MAEWLQQIGHSTADINALSIIHVAGTKGKGSTCAFTESFLRAHRRRTGYPAKTGLYTSPHLIYPEERIRLDSVPIERTLFAKYFFEVHHLLPQLRAPYDPSADVLTRGPRNLQLYALLAFHTFIREKVDVAIFETHSGGEYDATNVIQKPIVTAITTLGMDHIATLGPTIENIAWHKAGIFKAGAAALSTEQATKGTAQVLRDRAAEKGEQIRFVGDDARLPGEARQLEPRVQRQNASLALAVADAWLARKVTNESDGQLSSDDIHQGVEQWSWPGRFQIVHDECCTWYLDAAHNDMSVAIAAQWFASASTGVAPAGVKRILIFSHINELRDAEALLDSLATALGECEGIVTDVILTSYVATSADGTDHGLRDAGRLQTVWQRSHPRSKIWVEASVEAAIERASTVSRDSNDTEVHALITGSQHLVGPALGLLNARSTVVARMAQRRASMGMLEPPLRGLVRSLVVYAEQPAGVVG